MRPIHNTLLIFLLSQFLLAFSCQNCLASIPLKKFIPKSSFVYYRLGQTVIPIKLIQYGERKDIVYINLHDDEQTAVDAAKIILEKEGGLLIKIENREKRNIRFRLKGRYFVFDPNSMFSYEGAMKSLDRLGNVNEAAIVETTKFGQRILQFLPESLSCIIALHNNSKGNFGISSYLPGAERESDAQLVFQNPDESGDDIFLTTDSLLFHKLSSENYNTIWQDNENARQDGSLSVYCGQKNIRYVNCETEHGKTMQYLSMLKVLTKYIDKRNPDAIVYNYVLKLPEAVPFPGGSNIYFGDKIIGIIKSVGNRTKSEEISGQLEIDKNFKLWSNMDSFFFSTEGQPRIEIRIDPTREKKSFDASSEKIRIIAR